MRVESNSFPEHLRLRSPSRCDAILISHFLLNLQDISTIQTDSYSSQSSHTLADVTTIKFNAVLGNIGASLRDESGEFEYSEDRDADTMLDDKGLETVELRPTDARERESISSPELTSDVVVAGPSRHPDMHV